MEFLLIKKENFKARDPLSALTHFIGFLLVIPASIGMLQLCKTKKETFVFLIFSASMLLLYGASTIYHTLRISQEKIAFLRRIDHMMIFVMIAGTYTPVCLLTLEGKWGSILFAAIWSIAIVGMFIKIFWMGAPRLLSTLIYVGMGWLSLIVFLPLLHAVGWGGFLLLLGGGIAYSVGALIYGVKKPNLTILKSFGFHEIFHVFVMLGTAFHILFMFLYVLT